MKDGDYTYKVFLLYSQSLKNKEDKIIYKLRGQHPNMKIIFIKIIHLCYIFKKFSNLTFCDIDMTIE